MHPLWIMCSALSDRRGQNGNLPLYRRSAICGGHMSVQSKSRISFLTESRVWRSFFRHGWPDNPLDRSLVMTSNLFFHLHPVKVSRKSIRWSYSFGLGVISVILFAVLVFSGVVLMFYYIPSIERAYPTM